MVKVNDDEDAVNVKMRSAGGRLKKALKKLNRRIQAWDETVGSPHPGISQKRDATAFKKPGSMHK